VEPSPEACAKCADAALQREKGDERQAKISKATAATLLASASVLLRGHEQLSSSGFLG
jgi:hypothetical protein